MLSLCMIVKNESEYLERCLMAAERFVDEIIIVDTGSDDNTKEVASKFTDFVFDFEWVNDFSKARNFSIEKATNDWIVVLDADEFITEFNVMKENFLNDDYVKLLGRGIQLNITEDSYGIKKIGERISRVFNKRYYEYEGIIHEQPVRKDRSTSNYVDLNFKFDHLGYTSKVIDKTKKVQRNIDLLKKSLETDKKSPYLLYQLGKSYFMGKDFYNAKQRFEEALANVENFSVEYVEDLIESYGYALIELKEYIKALDLIEFEGLYGNKPDFMFLIGLIYMNNMSIEKAIDAFNVCTLLEEGKAEGISSYLPLYNIGVILECIGMKEEAIEYYKRCGKFKLAQNKINSHLTNGQKEAL